MGRKRRKDVGEAAAVAAVAAGTDGLVTGGPGGPLLGQRVPGARVLRPDLPAARAHQPDTEPARAELQER